MKLDVGMTQVPVILGALRVKNDIVSGVVVEKMIGYITMVVGVGGMVAVVDFCMLWSQSIPSRPRRAKLNTFPFG